MRLGRVICSLIAVAALLLVPAAGPAQGVAYPTPGISPPGANDFSCRPSAEHPVPVILAHGTFLDMTVSWNLVSPVLKREGWCVYAFDLVSRGTAPLEESAARLAAFVDRVLAATGAERVSFVGHSQGGMLPRYFVRFMGGLDEVDDIVGLAPPNHGTDTPLAPVVADVASCPACRQQMTGSEFMQRLNEGEEAPGPVSYTVVSTRYDEVVTPYWSQGLAGPHSTNVILQRQCPLDLTEHVLMPYDPVALQWALNALSRPGPADPGFRPDCTGLSAARLAPPELLRAR
jgi:triacylglycerol lipase